MRNRLLVLLGIILKSVGVAWTLQGFNLLGGSSMTGSPAWAVIGLIVFVAGLYVGYRGARSLRRAARGER